jgi:predicted O-methyltransferase YrrM
MRSVAHWTPRYVVNRVRYMAYERGAGAGAPWLTQLANQLLDGLLRPSDIGIEWGSGRSTLWFASRLKHLTSIEHDLSWYGVVKSKLEAAGAKNVNYQLLPQDECASEKCPYVRAVDEFPDSSLGFALVDGVLREQCITAVLPKIAPGGILCLDNAEWYLDHPTHSPGNRCGRGPLSDLWRDFENAVADWRLIWTTSGLSDTVIWIRRK